MNQKTVVLSCKLIQDYSTNYLVELLQVDFNIPDDIAITTHYENAEFGHADGGLISINNLITILHGLVDNGASHIAISYHTDHEEYNISAFQVTKAPREVAEEINELERALEMLVQKSNAAAKEYQEIQQQIYKLKQKLI